LVCYFLGTLVEYSLSHLVYYESTEEYYEEFWDNFLYEILYECEFYDVGQKY